MKLFADYEIDNGYKRISIWNIYYGYKAYIANEKPIDFKKYYEKFYKKRIFSTHSTVKMPMTLVLKHPYGKSFFRYVGNINTKGELESISHSIYKDIFNEMDILHLVVNKQQITLNVSYSDIEYYFKANGNDYYADVFIFFNKSIPEEYYYKWGGKLCIEIKHTHAVEKSKIYDCYKQGIAIFEHSISEKLLMNENIQSEEELLKRKDFITKKLSQKIYGKLISNPCTEDYQMLQTLKIENTNLKTENENLRKCNSSLSKQVDELKKNIEQLKMDEENLQHEHSNILQLKENINNHKLLKILLSFFKDLKNFL